MASSGGFARRNLQSPSTINPKYGRMNGMVVISALAILFFIVFIILVIHIYSKLLRRRSSIRGRLHHSLFSQDSPLRGGLDKEIVEALPIFGYKSPACLSNSTKAFEAIECVVCLSVFQQDETCKLLPKCKHFFHIDCIDMWFVSNTTCPLCRTAADPSDCGEVHDVAGSALCCYTNQDGGNELREQYQRAVEPNSGTRDDIACGNSNDDWERQGDTLLRGQFSLQSPTTSRNYRRSKSEKFSHGTHGGANVLFWGNHIHSTPRMNPTHWKTGGRSFSHTTIDILRPQETLVVVSSCPTLQGSPEPCSSLPHLVHRPLNELKSLKRFPSNK